ncbi:MAG: hypothetical protein DCC71_03635 [Proteobacteria bacterium]|nr:MAG: hypothetical protein DCC71_03635 [Pseudomonadota bacterium]
MAAVLVLGSLGAGPCVQRGPNFFGFLAPAQDLLTEPGVRRVELMVPFHSQRETLVVTLDGADVTPAFAFDGRVAKAQLDVAAGAHRLAATIELDPGFLGARETEARFEAVALQNPDACEVLNDVECALPFPSSRFQVADASTDTGVRMEYPDDVLPAISGRDLGNLLFGEPFPLSSAAFNGYDGVSPTVQPLMHFPGGVDLAASDAPRLLEATRNFDLRALDADSPSVLIDAATGERIAHFLENDARATGEYAARQATILRPGKSLLPGHRYIVALRRLVAPGGGAVAPEPVFRALRDRTPSTIAAVEARRAYFDAHVFPALAAAGVARGDLVLAFDFTVASDRDLTGAMLSMRDQAFAWLASADPASLFAVTEVNALSDCSQPGDVAWREVRGTFRVPNFLSSDPSAAPPPEADPVADTDTLGFLATDGAGTPLQTGWVDAPYGIAIPCSARVAPKAGLVLGHGLFGSGPDFPRDLAEGLETALPRFVEQGLVPPGTSLDLVAAGTNWSGLSTLEVPPLPDDLPGDLGDILNDPVLVRQIVTLLESFIGQLFLDFDQFAALPDRLRQGQLHALVLARLLHTGAFNVHPCFQALDPEPADCRSAAESDPSRGVLAAGEPSYYFGASLGGIMGLMFAALSPDVERASVNVPAINFSFLLQRSFAFAPFSAFLDFIAPDPLSQLLGMQVLHEIWVRGESAGYANHITGWPLAPLPGTNPKQVHLTPGRYDSVVPPLGAQIAAATMGVENLEGSVETDLPLVPDAPGPLASAHVLYDTGSYVLGEDDAFIPPLANTPPAGEGGACNPHGRVGYIPAQLRQLAEFLTPTGVVTNYCNGLCDGAEPLERPDGATERCDPTP